jgi:hypothetical protein
MNLLHIDDLDLQIAHRYTSPVSCCFCCVCRFRRSFCRPYFLSFELSAAGHRYDCCLALPCLACRCQHSSSFEWQYTSDHVCVWCCWVLFLRSFLRSLARSLAGWLVGWLVGWYLTVASVPFVVQHDAWILPRGRLYS